MCGIFSERRIVDEIDPREGRFEGRVPYAEKLLAGAIRAVPWVRETNQERRGGRNLGTSAAGAELAT